MEPNLLDKIFENLAKKAPELLTRNKLQEITGGLVTAKTLANIDSENKTGITPRLRVGGKVCYPKDAAIAWLKQRCEVLQEEGGKS